MFSYYSSPYGCGNIGDGSPRIFPAPEIGSWIDPPARREKTISVSVQRLWNPTDRVEADAFPKHWDFRGTLSRLESVIAAAKTIKSRLNNRCGPRESGISGIGRFHTGSAATNRRNSPLKRPFLHRRQSSPVPLPPRAPTGTDDSPPIPLPEDGRSRTSTNPG